MTTFQKTECPNCKEYMLTSPFEARCPICFFKSKDNIKLEFELPNIDDVIEYFKKMKLDMEAKEKDKGKGKGEGSGDGKKGKKQKKEKKEKKDVSAPVETPESVFGKAHIQVSRIASIAPHPNADSLFVADIDIGSETIKDDIDERQGKRKLVAGLAHYYKAEELEGKLVCTVLNLKASKLRGILSEVMLLAGDFTEDEKKVVKILEAPAGSEVGDRIYLAGHPPLSCDGSVPVPPQMNSKVWQKIVAGLSVKDKVATFNKIKLVSDRGEIGCPLPDSAGIH